MLRARLLLFAVLLLVPVCRHARPRPAEAPRFSAASTTTPARFIADRPNPQVLIIAETSSANAKSAYALRTLLAHFNLVSNTVSPRHFHKGSMAAYRAVFYLAAGEDSLARSTFAADLSTYAGIATWVGPGAASMGQISGVRESARSGRREPADWTISYSHQSHRERLALPDVTCDESAALLASARRGRESRPFLWGKDKRWYVAVGPSLDRTRFWTACIWADALHEILGQPHNGEPRRLVPVLRDVPVWTTAVQVPDAIRPMLAAGVPVAVLASTVSKGVPLADRPEAIQGLRAAERLGATIVLSADEAFDAREQFRVAWEIGIHPIAWAGPSTGTNPFRLRIAAPSQSPPLSAGGLLPAPIAISDAGYVAAGDLDQLAMLRAVRDAVALMSFGLWAPPTPFRSFLDSKRSAGWRVSDLRELGVRVDDTRRVLLSGDAPSVRVSSGAKVRQLTYSRDWKLTKDRTQVSGTATLSAAAPLLAVTSIELPRQIAQRPFVKGVTLDPWAYGRSSLSARDLAEKLAARYRQNGVNAVFFYAYNVKQGAAYRTRFGGAVVSDWGKQDLLRELLVACHASGIRVIAWMYSGRDAAMWKKHPEWRERTRDGKDYNPLRLHAAYFLCPRNPEVQRWYAGLLGDLGERYPDLDGIELCEPVVNWFGDQACYCQVCNRDFAQKHPGEPLGKQAWRRFRSEGMTAFLNGCIAAIANQGIDSYLMTLSDAWSNGAILAPRRQSDESGLDMEALLDGPHPPDWVNYEIIWQQWAALYGTQAFNYDWAEQTAARLARRTDGRARVLFHLELTDFGSQHMTPAKMTETIDHVKAARPNGIECYHSYALDSRGAWPALKQSYEKLP